MNQASPGLQANWELIHFDVIDSKGTTRHSASLNWRVHTYLGAEWRQSKWLEVETTMPARTFWPGSAEELQMSGITIKSASKSPLSSVQEPGCRWSRLAGRSRAHRRKRGRRAQRGLPAFGRRKHSPICQGFEAVNSHWPGAHVTAESSGNASRRMSCPVGQEPNSPFYIPNCKHCPVEGC